MMGEAIGRDERTTSVENGSYRWAYLVLSFGLLLSTAYRGFFLEQQSWDLLALVVLGGVITTTYQGTHRVLTRRWALVSLGALVGAVLLGVILVAVLR